ncbi:glycoside hydrolase [Paenibacillus sp. MY03]|uniref:carbohydrate binding domain-containing protein n=1 Tax=Paenibacillus sp. MY03 TaxID=302980 RepID=UPI000B3C066D|nr:carbohydrate binding domain-containing protein [Paenibacillus sp. MY03]OUS77940.1 glycoside hydrolase [Paenibacillus sp. MY03]
MRKKWLSWFLILAIVCSLIPAPASASIDDSGKEAAVPSEKLWGEALMRDWIARGLLSGYPDGSLRPNEPVTRAQFAKLLNTLFQYIEGGSVAFSDVENGAWYAADVRNAAAAGVISGFPGGLFKPGDPIRRQDAAKLLDTAFHLTSLKKETGKGLSAFSDAASVHGYAAKAIERLVSRGYMNGYPDGTIRPLRAVTRAEAVSLLAALAGEVIGKASVIRDVVYEGNLLIGTSGVRIMDSTIKDHVYIAPGVGEGEAFFEGTSILGNLFVSGGGVNSIYLTDTDADELVVNKKGGPVRIVVGEGSQVGTLQVESEAIIELENDARIDSLVFRYGAEGSELRDNGGFIGEIVNDAGIAIQGGSSTRRPSPTPTSRPVTGPTTGPTAGPTASPTAEPSAEPSPSPTTEPEKAWRLVWNDEFDRSGDNLDDNGIDLDKWGYQLGTGAQYGLDGWGNNEQQYYRSENMIVDEETDMLIVTAKKETHQGKPYTSGRIYTEPTFSQTYGKFEARMKLPAGEGVWPAFWMMPKDSEYGVWAASGELDIMEARGRLPEEVGGTIHFGRNWPNNKATGDEYHFPEGEDITGFHTYGVEWEPGEIRWYVDGNLYQTLNNWDSWGADQPAKYAYPAPFDKPFYMILNLAIGGNYDGGRLPKESDLPAQMLVDYVRVYEPDGWEYREPLEPQIDAEPYPDAYKAPINGNFVYDGEYGETFTNVTEAGQSLNEDFWNFVTVGTFLGQATVSVEELDGKRFAKADIEAGGNAAHAVQLIQNVTLGKGRWYKLSFDAKSNASRTMTVKLGGGENRGWSVYSDSLEARLNDSLQGYEMTFQMTAETDTLARLEFNMGLATYPVWIGNVKLEEVAAADPYKENDPKTPLADGNHVFNGNFDLGHLNRLTYWKLSTKAGAEAAVSVDPIERQLEVSISRAGGEAGDIVLAQRGIELIEGNDYSLSFQGSAAANRTVTVALASTDGAVYDEEQAALEPGDLTGRSVSLRMDGANDRNAVLLLMFGGADADVRMDDIRLTRLTNNNVGEPDLNAQYPLKNGDFSNGKLFWSEHVQGRYDGWDGATSFSVAEGAMNAFVSSTGNNPWDVMLMQTDFELAKGLTYVVSVDARSTVARETELVVDSGNTRLLSERVGLTSEWQTFSYELPVTTDVTASFKMLLGRLDGAAALSAHEVYVDNVKLELKGARDAAFLAKNGYFDDGLAGWNSHVQGVYDGPSAAAVSGESGALKADIGHAGLNPWDIVVSQDAVELKKGKTYIVKFDARSTMPRIIEVTAENAAYTRFLNQPARLEDYTQTYSYEFTMNSDENASLKFLLGKMANQDGTIGHELFIDNVRFELKGAMEATGEKARTSNDITLPKPPAVSPDATGNLIDAPLTLTFADSAVWREGIYAVIVNGEALELGDYTIGAGTITLAAGVLGQPGMYAITIKAVGYEPASVSQEVLAEEMWTLVWNDEFDGTGTQLDDNGLDLARWAYQQGTGSDYGLDSWGNNELQYYKKDNVKVENGSLLLEAKPDTYGGKTYTSGRLWTSPTFGKAYGKFEARMKLPAGQGLWPAFWLMPRDSEYGGWASSGEIDIMEARGRLPETVDGTIHYGKGAPNNKATGSHYVFPEGEDFTGFHTYSLEWEPGELRWYVDGNLYQTINDWHSWGTGQPDKYAFPAPFDKEFYIIMNLAVGGNYDGGRLPDPGAFPATMEVDYVRVYELTGRPYSEPVEPQLVADEFPEGGKEAIGGNFLYDIGFAEGINSVTDAAPDMDPVYWNFLHDNQFGGSGTASVETIDGAKFAKLDLTAGGNANYALQLIQYLTLVKGKSYKLSFDAKASAARNMSIKFGGDANSNWAIYSDNFDAGLTEVVKSYEYRFQMTGDTNTAARLEFNVGQNVADVWIGKVRVEEIDMVNTPDDPKNPLDNGNHVYNGSFDLGTMDRMKYWHVYAGGTASAVLGVKPDERYLSASIEAGGASPSDIVLSQKGIELLQSDTYRLSLEGWADGARSIEVRLRGKDGAVFAGPFSVLLGTERATIAVAEFDMPAGVSDAEAELDIALGGSSVDVYLDNVTLIRTSNRNVDFAGVDLYPVRNGDFHFGLSGWEPFVQGGAATFESVGGEARINVTNVGSAGWNIMLNQSNLKLEGGLTYVLSFEASASIARDIEVSLENAGYVRRFFSGALALTGEKRRFEFVFRMPMDEILALKIMTGKTANSPSGAHAITIDNVVLAVQYSPLLQPATVMSDESDNRIGEAVALLHSPSVGWAEALTQVAVNGTALDAGLYEKGDGEIVIAAEVFAEEGLYDIVLKSSGYADVAVLQQMLAGDGNLVLNGGMSQGLANWETWEGEGGDSTVTADNGVAKAVIHWHGGMHPTWNVPVGWSTQFMQSGIRLEAGKTYELSFNAWATASRPIVTELGGYNNNQSLTFALTTNAADLHKTTLRPSSNVNLSLKFLLGNVVSGALTTPDEEHTVFIDNVAIKEVKAPPVLAADSVDNKLGQPITLTFDDDAEWRSAVARVLVNGAAASLAQVTMEAGVITLAAELFPAIATYSIAIEAPGYGVASVQQKMLTAAPNVALPRAGGASASSENGAAGAASRAFDGNAGTRWESVTGADPQWLAIDLGGVYALDGITLQWEGAYAKAYKLQASTAVVPGEGDWVDLFSEANGNGGLDEIALGGEEARHIRMYGTVRGTPWGYSLWELELYGSLVSEGDGSF